MGSVSSSMVILSEERLSDIKNILYHCLLIFPKFHSSHEGASSMIHVHTDTQTAHATSCLKPPRFPVANLQLEKKGRGETAEQQKLHNT